MFDWTTHIQECLRSRHMRNLADDQRVSVAIYPTDQPPGEHVRGMQMQATATVVPDDEVAQACDIYFARYGARQALDVDLPNPLNYTGTSDENWRFVRLTPTAISYFNSQEFAMDRVEVPMDAWKQR